MLLTSLNLGNNWFQKLDRVNRPLKRLTKSIRVGLNLVVRYDFRHFSNRKVELWQSEGFICSKMKVALWKPHQVTKHGFEKKGFKT